MKYQVIVGNIGTVYDGNNHSAAQTDYEEYVRQSKTGCGRAGSEDVTWLRYGEVYKEYTAGS